MTAALRFDPIRLPEKCEQLRKEVRAFLAEEIAAGTFDPHKPNREDTDVPFAHGEQIVGAWAGSRLESTSGLGHRALLRDPSVIARTVAFLREDSSG